MPLKLVKSSQANTSSNQISLDSLNPESIRANVLQASKDFKNSWKNLAKALYQVYRDKTYKNWGFATFDGYTAQEIKIRKNTAMKLIYSYNFLEKENPQYLNDEHSQQNDTNDSLPSYEAVNTLRLAKTKLEPNEYEKFKKQVFEDGRDPQEVKKDISCLIRERKPLDPEKENQQRSRIRTTQFILALKSFKRDLEMLKFLPLSLTKDINQLIEKVQQACDQEYGEKNKKD